MQGNSVDECREPRGHQRSLRSRALFADAIGCRRKDHPSGAEQPIGSASGSISQVAPPLIQLTGFGARSGRKNTPQTPKEGTDALDTAVSAGLITSNFPVASASGSYPNSSSTMNPANQPICSGAAECKNGDQTYDLPDGLVALSFDDVPLPASKQLHAFCGENNQKETYFYIGTLPLFLPLCSPPGSPGSNILENPDLFEEVFSVNGDDVAVHTWPHPYML
ncbi:hypothetical protein FS749_002546 [Ceratobasidium sp. UAMH 11750]|nr:hypothetical protein FS749_002546 [Ceratobasidium sp. UAMH 11750]